MIILEILKWIGIILLFLLLILLCVLLLVLFLPIKYYGEGTYNREKQCAIFKARWFWGLVRVRAAFPGKPYFSVKVLWLELLKGEQKEPETAKEETVAEQIVKQEERAVPPVVGEKAPEPMQKDAEEELPRPSQESSSQENPEKEPILDKLVGMKEKIQYYINIFQEQETKELLAHCKVRIVKILKSIRPRKLVFRGTVGFATPDTTGYLYGGYCMISSYLGKNVILTPDFENEIVDVSGSLKGHITVFVLAWNALRIYLDKRLMRLIRKLKKGGR